MSRLPAVPLRPITVVIADDHAIVRDGLRALVDAEVGMGVIGEAADGEEAWRRTCELKPDILVLDISMPTLSGSEVAARVANDCPQVRVIALTMHEERGYVARLLKAGVAGYVLKRSAAVELVRAIRSVALGKPYVDPSLAGALLSEPATRPNTSVKSRERSGASSRLPDLTAREIEILSLVARGHSNKEIASTLDISVKTVETHKTNGLTKLGLTSRAALVRFAVDEGWLADIDQR